MPNGGTAGQTSTLGAIAQKAQAARAIRTRLNMDAPNGAPSGGLQSAGPVSPQAGLGKDTGQSASQGAGEPLDIDKMVADVMAQKGPAMMQAYQQHLAGQQGGDQGDQGAQPAPAAPAPDGPTFQGPSAYMQPESEPLSDRLQRYGAMSSTPVEQFARVAGRLPSPQELTVFNARNTLEGQLGRPPTSNELKLYLIKPDDESQSFPRAFESPAGPAPGAPPPGA